MSRHYWLSLCLCLALASPATAQGQDANAEQTPQDKALELARAGAGHFKAKRFLDAARAFEQAYRANPVDPRNLRYAGRAWQEVGALSRALSLLERYALVEKNPKYKASIQARVDALRKLTPRQRAESLAKATVNYPQGKLEIDAARALARLGEKSDLERALKLYETARIWAIDAVTRAQIDQALDKIRTALTKPKPKPIVAKPVKPAPVTPAPVAPAPPVVKKAKTRPSSVGWFVSGGILTAVGVGVAAWSASEATLKGTQWSNSADSTYQNKTYGDYESDHNGLKMMHYGGLAAAGLGGVALVVGLVRSLSGGESTALQLAPRLSPNNTGLALSGRF